MEFVFVRNLPRKPEGTGQKAVFEAFRKALLAHRGRWAIYPGRVTNDHGAEMTAYVINSNRRPAFPSRTFEAEARGGVVYVRARPRE